ncbi:hypothetical protein O0L34_g4705 [Tuta absoluta]|nr:hypothetical protein O0L34_g4705 [Tuta absoluta]
MDYTRLEKVQFVNTAMPTPFPKEFTSDLPILTLELSNVTNFYVPDEFFVSSVTLRELVFGFMEVPKLPPPKALQLESLTLKYSPLKSWDNCQHLKQLIVEGLQKEQIPKWPSNCTQLMIIRLESMSLEAVHHLTKTMDGSSVAKLEILAMKNCSLRELPLNVMQSQKFREIYFSDNNLDDKAILQFPKMPNLEILDLSNNQYIISNVPLLHSFPSTQAQQLVVDVRGVPVKYVSIGPEYLEGFEHIPRSRFWLTNKAYKLIVHLDSVDCDCNNHILQRALRVYPHFLSMPDLKCHHGRPFLEEPAENLSCRKASVNGCVRRMSRGRNYTSIVDCSRNAKQFRWPQPRGFRGFNASGNRITSLDKAYLPDSLEWLDLRNNSISRLDGEQSTRLFGNKGRRVWLAGNPIACDCDNQPLLDALHVNQSLVMDFDNLTCADSGQLLRLVSAAELCRPRLVTVSVTTSLIAVILLVAALLIRHYWTSLRMVLYAHGCCLSCLREKDLDEDRPFDAFLSFAHGDDQYVMEQLLPQLEGEPNNYRICVHYRDWSVGEWIPAQIMKSVRRSKRTIIVLSKNFVKSCWGVLEFRHANAGAAADGRKRLLVLVLDDVLSEKLSPELQGYLELNTYLECSDPWFWEKLRYAMPHKDNEHRDKKVCRNFGSLGSSLNTYSHNVVYTEATLSMPKIHLNDTLCHEVVPNL